MRYNQYMLHMLYHIPEHIVGHINYEINAATDTVDFIAILYRLSAAHSAHLMQQEIKYIAEGQAKGSQNLPGLFLDFLIDAQANCSVFGRR